MVLFGSLERMYFGEFNRILTKNVLLFYIYLIITTTLVSSTNATAAATATSTKLKNGMVPEDQWVCGATEFDRVLAYQRTNESCRDVSWAINSCCAVHDTCYLLDKSQEECDVPFCACLEAQAKLSNNPDCGQVLEGFCFIVQIFGGIAHANAKEKANQTINLTLIEPLTTTELPIASTTTTPTTTTTTVPSTEIPPRRLDNTEEECFSPELNYCIAEFETCQHKDKIELLKCEERMCQCTKASLRNEAKPNCRYPIEMACIIPDSSFPTLSISESDEPESLLSTKIEIFGFSATLLTVLIFLMITLLPVSFGIWLLYRYVKTRRTMPLSPSRTPLCAASSAESGLACGSNDTLSSDEGVKIARYPY